MSSNTIGGCTFTVQPPRITDAMYFELFAQGFTSKEIEHLKEVVAYARKHGKDRVVFRPQARLRRAPVFGLQGMLYPRRPNRGRKGHASKQKKRNRMPCTVVWSCGYWHRPFPEVMQP